MKDWNEIMSANKEMPNDIVSIAISSLKAKYL